MNKFQTLSAVIALSVISIQVQASIIDLNLTGTVSQAATGSIDSGATHYDYWQLSLNPFSPVTAQLGDTINTTITFDQNITIPTSISGSSFVFGISGDSFPSVNTAISGYLNFSNNGAIVVDNTDSPSTTTTAGQFSTAASFLPTQTLTFNSVYSSFTITDLSGNGPVTLNTAFAQTWLYSPITAVPVPGALVLMLSGLSLIGWKSRSKQNKLIATAA